MRKSCVTLQRERERKRNPTQAPPQSPAFACPSDEGNAGPEPQSTGIPQPKQAPQPLRQRLFSKLWDFQIRFLKTERMLRWRACVGDTNCNWSRLTARALYFQGIA